ncbi:hypothetical protein BTO20_16310 [Mycobacterium dioxanotrophicus]|uniref:Terminase n=1 Tax=Mycobacterium dioxanotrophicus TaxID=482462 RepID=A0A1Y0C421_9MYCO|nr:P27 family phage terminase small subunit [Mycobacterium dioxanotrophicus]ART69930.1 hypothetical protein BTO20_16310 [Mycobacterium dioxanotrophicus]
MTHEPPRPLAPAARAVWDRHDERITEEGRWEAVDHDLLAVYAETHAVYDELVKAILETGVLVAGRRGAAKVKNPALPALQATRDSLMRLAKSVPLVDREVADKTAEFHRWMEGL